MINLLPYDAKAEIRAARTNVLLIRYTIITVLAVGFVLGAMYATGSVLALTKDNSEKIVAANNLKAGIYNSTQTQVDTLNGTLAQAKQVLDQENQYSKALTSIGQLMPPGTIFGNLTIDSNSFNGTPLTTKVYAKTANDLTLVRSRFQTSPLFVSLVFQPPTETGSDIEGYPVSADVSFALNKAVLR